MKPPYGSPGSCGTPSPPDTIRLAGPTIRLDPRVHAFRNDLADIALAGRRFAPHYAQAEPTRCVAGFATVHATPRDDGVAISQLLRGEGFALLDREGGWAWGYCLHDGYVGYARADALGPPEVATHRVAVPLALVFAEPNIKAPVVGQLSMGAQVAGTEAAEFVRIAEGYVHHRHLDTIAAIEPDWTAMAERLIGAPYRWGGRGGGGIDCSGLVQLALQAAGRSCPRDSDQQRETLGVLLDDDAPPVRGDLTFFPGHVGIMVDETRMVHANAWWMAVTVEPLAHVVERLTTQHPKPLLAIRRIIP